MNDISQKWKDLLLDLFIMNSKFRLDWQKLY